MFFEYIHLLSAGVFTISVMLLLKKRSMSSSFIHPNSLLSHKDLLKEFAVVSIGCIYAGKMLHSFFGAQVISWAQRGYVVIERCLDKTKSGTTHFLLHKTKADPDSLLPEERILLEALFTPSQRELKQRERVLEAKESMKEKSYYLRKELVNKMLERKSIRVDNYATAKKLKDFVDPPETEGEDTTNANVIFSRTNILLNTRLAEAFKRAEIAVRERFTDANLHKNSLSSQFINRSGEFLIAIGLIHMMAQAMKEEGPITQVITYLICALLSIPAALGIRRLGDQIALVPKKKDWKSSIAEYSMFSLLGLIAFGLMASISPAFLFGIPLCLLTSLDQRHTKKGKILLRSVKALKKQLSRKYSYKDRGQFLELLPTSMIFISVKKWAARFSEDAQIISPAWFIDESRPKQEDTASTSRAIPMNEGSTPNQASRLISPHKIAPTIEFLESIASSLVVQRTDQDRSPY